MKTNSAHFRPRIYFKNTDKQEQDAIHDRPKSLRVRALQSDHETGTSIARFIFFVMRNPPRFTSRCSLLFSSKEAMHFWGWISRSLFERSNRSRHHRRVLSSFDFGGKSFGCSFGREKDNATTRCSSCCCFCSLRALISLAKEEES